MAWAPSLGWARLRIWAPAGSTALLYLNIRNVLHLNRARSFKIADFFMTSIRISIFARTRRHENIRMFLSKL
jgi:hypothetical protein